MEMTVAILNKNVNPQISDEIKCLLKEIYNISEGEASFIINNAVSYADTTPEIVAISEIMI